MGLGASLGDVCMWAVPVVGEGARGSSLACPLVASGHVVAAERGGSAPLRALGVRTVVNVTGLRPRESLTSLAQLNRCDSSIVSVVAALLGSVVVVLNAADVAVSAGAVMVVVAVVVTGWTLDWVRTGVRNTVP